MESYFIDLQVDMVHIQMVTLSERSLPSSELMAFLLIEDRFLT